MVKNGVLAAVLQCPVSDMVVSGTAVSGMVVSGVLAKIKKYMGFVHDRE
jgi:hypothetical protein